MEKNKQLPYRPIHNLGPIKLKILKTYIKTNLSNGFIQASKFLVDALILIIRKLNDSICLYVNYWEVNNLTIKNWYLLLLISKSLDWLSRAK